MKCAECSFGMCYAPVVEYVHLYVEPYCKCSCRIPKPRGGQVMVATTETLTREWIEGVSEEEAKRALAELPCTCEETHTAERPHMSQIHGPCQGTGLLYPSLSEPCPCPNRAVSYPGELSPCKPCQQRAWDKGIDSDHHAGLPCEMNCEVCHGTKRIPAVTLEAVLPVMGSLRRVDDEGQKRMTIIGFQWGSPIGCAFERFSSMGTGWEFWAEGDTALHAACRAALLANLEVE